MTGRPQISAVIITLDAGGQLEDCLRSLHFVDEIVIVDSGSTDATASIAKSFNARFETNPWPGYGAQKRIAVAHAKFDWVLCIDADERVSAELANAILTALASSSRRAYALARSNRFMGRYLRHGEGYPDWSLRLFDRRVANWSEAAVHETVISAVEVERLRGGDLLHHSADDLGAYLDKQNRYTTLQAAELYRAGRRTTPARMLTAPVLRFIKFYLVRGGCLDGVAGLVHITIGCINSFTKYAKLLALQRGAS